MFISFGNESVGWGLELLPSFAIDVTYYAGVNTAIEVYPHLFTFFH